MIRVYLGFQGRQYLLNSWGGTIHQGQAYVSGLPLIACQLALLNNSSDQYITYRLLYICNTDLDLGHDK